MKVGMFTREYPPEVYGGAGVHVTELTRFMRDIVDVDVHCMGAPRDAEGVYVHGVDPALEDANGAIKTLSTGLRMADAAAGLDVYNNEPRVDPALLALGNVVLLPHLGSATVGTRDAMGFKVLDGLDAVLAGQTPPNLVP